MRSPMRTTPASLPEHVFARHIATRLAAANLARTAQASRGMRGLADPSLRQRQANRSRLSKSMQAALMPAARPFAAQIMQAARAIRDFHATPSRKNQIIARMRSLGWSEQQDIIWEQLEIDGYALPPEGQEPTGIHVTWEKAFVVQGRQYLILASALLNTPKFKFKPADIQASNFITLMDAVTDGGIVAVSNVHTNRWMYEAPGFVEMIRANLRYVGKLATHMAARTLGVTVVHDASKT